MPHDDRHSAITLGHHDGAPYLLADEHRRRHLYTIGQSGVGKTTLLLNAISEDLAAGRGVAVIDPLGTLASAAIPLVPSHRAHELIYLRPADVDRPIGFNPLQHAHPDQHAIVADDIVSAFVHAYGESAVGHRSQQILRNSVRALLETPGSTLLGVVRLLLDSEYRERTVRRVHDPVVATFWRDEWAAWSVADRTSWSAPLLNKLDALIGSPQTRNMLGQSSGNFDLRRTMDDGRILIVDLSRIGEANAHILGSFIITSISQAAFSRADIPGERRTPFYLYIDEFAAVAGGGLSRMLAMSRAMGLALTLAHQFLGQLSPDLRHAVLGSASNLVALRVGADDAALIAEHMTLSSELEYTGMGVREVTGADRLMMLEKYRAFARVPDDRAHTGAVGLDLLPPPLAANRHPQRLIARCRSRWGRDRTQVEAAIAGFLRPSQKPTARQQVAKFLMS